MVSTGNADYCDNLLARPTLVPKTVPGMPLPSDKLYDSLSLSSSFHLFPGINNCSMGIGRGIGD